MQVHTMTNMEFEPTPMQIGEPFRCWECGSPDQGGTFLIIDHSPLEVYADHIYYMRLACRHNPRCVRLGDAIAPLSPLDRSMDENLASVREGLSNLAKAVPSDQRNQEPLSEFDQQVKHIVYLLVAGQISPQAAINRLRGLAQPDQQLLPGRLPAGKQT